MGSFESRLGLETWTADSVRALERRWTRAFRWAPELTAREFLSLVNGGGYPPSPKNLSDLVVAEIFEAFKLGVNDDPPEEQPEPQAEATPKSGPEAESKSTPNAEAKSGSESETKDQAVKPDGSGSEKAGSTGANHGASGGTGRKGESDKKSAEAGGAAAASDAKNNEEESKTEIGTEAPPPPRPETMNMLAFFAVLHVACEAELRVKLEDLFSLFDFNSTGHMDGNELVVLVMSTWTGVLQVGIWSGDCCVCGAVECVLVPN